MREFYIFYDRQLKGFLPIWLRKILKWVWALWGYRSVLLLPRLSWHQKIHLVQRFVRIDLNVPHAHFPGEIALLTRELTSRPAHPGEIVLEAGCWKGGSTAKFSLLCALFGYRLHVFDSFQGVERIPVEEGSWDFAGQYQAGLSEVKNHVKQYGEIGVCDFFPGWFADTLAGRPLNGAIRMAYIDCDLAKGTFEVLQSVCPQVAEDGIIFTQDYHIPPVKKLLNDPETWKQLGCAPPRVQPLYHNLARLELRKSPKGN